MQLVINTSVTGNVRVSRRLTCTLAVVLHSQENFARQLLLCVLQMKTIVTLYMLHVAISDQASIHVHVISGGKVTERCVRMSTNVSVSHAKTVQLVLNQHVHLVAILRVRYAILVLTEGLQ